jgi:hypothetical protein
VVVVLLLQLLLLTVVVAELHVRTSFAVSSADVAVVLLLVAQAVADAILVQLL